MIGVLDDVCIIHEFLVNEGVALMNFMSAKLPAKFASCQLYEP